MNRRTFISSLAAIPAVFLPFASRAASGKQRTVEEIQKVAAEKGIRYTESEPYGVWPMSKGCVSKWWTEPPQYWRAVVWASFRAEPPATDMCLSLAVEAESETAALAAREASKERFWREVERVFQV